MRTSEKPAFTNAQDFVEFFRKGGEVHRKKESLPNLLIDNRLDPKAIKVLGEELATGIQVMRKRIIDLLNELRRLVPPGRELRDPDILGLLFGPGFAKSDGARSNAIEVLRWYTSPATLLNYRDAIMQALKEPPTNAYVLLLVAKAKPLEAWEEVDRQSRLPEWRDKPAMRIARAALGDTRIEDEYIAAAERAEAAGWAEGLDENLSTLSWIGTPRSLRFICLRFRSPLIIKGAGGYDRLVRTEAVNALRYAYPGEVALDTDFITNEEGFTRAEAFCARTFGVNYAGIPRPPYPPPGY